MATITEPLISPIPTELHSAEADSFSLTRGGLLFRIQVRLGVAAEDPGWTVARAIAGILITWLPLLILSLAEGVAYNKHIQVPFLKDFAANARFLIALPVLIVSEIGIDGRLRLLVKHFVTSGLVPESEIPFFEATIQKLTRLRDRLLPELVLFALAFLPSLSVPNSELLMTGASTWHSIPPASDATLSYAGWWFGLVSAPIYRFLLLRWLWRMFLWARFLWQASRLRLVLTPTHPDLAAGLGFLAAGQQRLAAIGFAGSVVVAAQAGNAIAYQGAHLAGLKYTIIGYCVFAVMVLVAPLLLLIPRLVRVKRRGMLEYGTLATHYTTMFDLKWVHGRPGDNEALLGSPDIQSLADLNNSFAIVRQMRTAPVDKSSLFSLALVTVLPMAPLLLLSTPTEDLFRTVFKLLL